MNPGDLAVINQNTVAWKDLLSSGLELPIGTDSGMVSISRGDVALVISVSVFPTRAAQTGRVSEMYYLCLLPGPQLGWVFDGYVCPPGGERKTHETR